MQQCSVLVVTAFGLESVVVHELAGLGLAGKPVSTGRVLVECELDDIPTMNINLRCAERVQLVMGRFEAPDFDALFDQTRGLPWEDLIPREFAFPVDGRSVKSQLSSVPAVQRTVKKAIVDRLMEAHQTDTLPESGPTVRVEVSLLDNMAVLTADTTGEGLHKRGYREIGGHGGLRAPVDAALRETMAAALVLLSPWRPHQRAGEQASAVAPTRAMWDPFCGSGTVIIEAAMIGLNKAPGVDRTFVSEQWPLINGKVWRECRERARSAERSGLAAPLVGSDVDFNAIDIARRAAVRAGVGQYVEFVLGDFRKVPEQVGTSQHGVVISNPPYGIRLGETREIEMVYRDMPMVFAKLPTWSFGVLTGRQDFERVVGQRASRRRKLFNAEIECTYFTFFGPRPARVFDAAGGFEGEAETAAIEVGADEGAVEVVGVVDAGDAVGAVDVADAVNVGHVADGQHVERADTGAEQLTEATSVEVAESVGAVFTPERARMIEPPSDAPAFGGLRPKDIAEAEEFARCLSNNLRHLRKYPSRGITNYRIYERDYPEVPLIIDLYGDAVHAVEYEREHSRTLAQHNQWLDLLRQKLCEECGVRLDDVFLKPKHRQRGLTQFEKFGDRNVTRIVQEGGLKFEVNLSDYIDTGLFLDHRLTRAMVAKHAKGKRVLNLFCYTGSFTVYAGAAGAAATTSVDLSNTYLDWCERNLRLNGLWDGPHDLVRSDVMAYLQAHSRAESDLYDMMIVDPPTFSNSTSTDEDWQVAQRQSELFNLLAPLLSPTGVVYFSTNYRRFKLDEAHLAKLGLSAREISKQTVAPEYRNERIHRCWLLRHAAVQGQQPVIESSGR